MKKLICCIFTLSLLAASAWATTTEEDLDTLQGYSDVVNEAATYIEDEENGERAAQDTLIQTSEETDNTGLADSPYRFNSGRIAQILDEDQRDEDEDELQQRYAAMHDEEIITDEENAAF